MDKELAIKAMNRCVSEVEEWRMFLGAVELSYFSPSRKRLKEMMDYSQDIVYDNTKTRSARKKANFLYQECVFQDSARKTLEMYAKMRREGKL